MTKQTEWYLNHDNIVMLAQYMLEMGDDASNIVYMIEKPHKFETEFKRAKDDQTQQGRHKREIIQWLVNNTDADEEESVAAVEHAIDATKRWFNMPSDKAGEEIWKDDQLWNN